MSRGKLADAGTLAVTATVIRFSPSTIVCTTTIAAAILCSRGDNIQDTEEPERSDKDKRKKIPLLVHVCEDQNIEGKMGPELIALELALVVSGPGTPRQLRLLPRKMQKHWRHVYSRRRSLRAGGDHPFSSRYRGKIPTIKLHQWPHLLEQ